MENLSQAVLQAFDSWASPAILVDKLGPTARRVRIGADGPQAVYYRASNAPVQEPFLEGATDEEVAQLRVKIGRPEDVVFPYGRRNGGALVRIRNASEADAIKDVLIQRAKGL